MGRGNRSEQEVPMASGNEAMAERFGFREGLSSYTKTGFTFSGIISALRGFFWERSVTLIKFFRSFPPSTCWRCSASRTWPDAARVLWAVSDQARAARWCSAEVAITRIRGGGPDERRFALNDDCSRLHSLDGNLSNCAATCSHLQPSRRIDAISAKRRRMVANSPTAESPSHSLGLSPFVPGFSLASSSSA